MKECRFTFGDIRFTEMQTTLRMHTVHFRTFIRYVEQGSFNADKLPLEGCSQTTAILLPSSLTDA